MDVRSSTGEKFVLERAVNRGGEAQIWTIQQDPHLVAKLYHKPTPEHKAKLAAMIATPLSRTSTHPTVAWPLQILYQKDSFVGYLMPRAASSLPLFHYYNPARRRRLGLPHAWPRFAHRTAQNLAAAVELVHENGHIIGDLNESNVLVTQTAMVTLVDTDSFQIRAGATAPRPQNWLVANPALQLYRCGVGKAEYTPPELQGVDFKRIDRTAQHDNFALAVLIFYLLMDGFHPFAGVLTSAASVGRVDLYGIKHGLFPYLHRGPNGQPNGQLVVQPPPNAPAFAQLHPTIQDAFRRTFTDGHAQPDRRVSAKEWKKILHEAGASLVSCSQDATHLYSRHLRHCPTCPPPAAPAVQAVKGMPRPATASTKVAHTMPLPVPSLPTGWLVTWPLLPGLAASQMGKRVSQLQQQVPNLNAAVQQVHANWQSYLNGAQTNLAELPARFNAAKHTLMAHAGLLGDWLLGNLVGLVMALLVIGIGYPRLPQLTMLPQTDRAQAMLLGLVFATLLGASQSYALRDSVLRWAYLRQGWVLTAALTGTLFGAASFHLLGADWVQVSAWPLPTLVVTILAAGFGALLGFLQSLLLRQQLRLADDGRLWALVNGITGLLGAQGWFWGQSWLYGWQQADFPDWQINGALGVLLGVGIGSLLSGGVLLWLAQGPRRSFYLHQFALNLVRWSLRPGQLRRSAVRWTRAFLLLIILWLLLQMASQLHDPAASVAPPLPTEFVPHIAPLSATLCSDMDIQLKFCNSTQHG